MKIKTLDVQRFVVLKSEFKKMDGLVDIEITMNGKNYYWAKTLPLSSDVYELIYLSYEPIDIEFAAEKESEIKHSSREDCAFDKGIRQLYNTIRDDAKRDALQILREKCLEHQDFHRGDDGEFRGWISVEDLDYIINEVAEK